MKNALVYSCVLLLLSCGGKTGGTSQSSSTNQETQENALSEKTTAIYGAQNETYIEGWEKKTSNLLIYKRLCKI